VVDKFYWTSILKPYQSVSDTLKPSIIYRLISRRINNKFWDNMEKLLGTTLRMLSSRIWCCSLVWRSILSLFSRILCAYDLVRDWLEESLTTPTTATECAIRKNKVFNRLLWTVCWKVLSWFDSFFVAISTATATAAIVPLLVMFTVLMTHSNSVLLLSTSYWLLRSCRVLWNNWDIYLLLQSPKLITS